jgi:ferredoxin-NADP reductase
MPKKRTSPFSHRVISNIEYSPNCFELEMTRHGMEYEPGSFITIHGKCYSLASSPRVNKNTIKILVRKFPGGKVSQKLANLHYGASVEIGDPSNYFKPGTVEKYCYIATGVGISPFLSALRTYTHKPLMILYGAKTRTDLYERVWLKSNFNIQFAVSQDEKHFGIHKGRITDLLDQLPISDDITYYLCGIEGMITDTSKYLTDKGIPYNHIQQELFYANRD